MYGSRRGYVSRTCVRIPRATEDFTLVLALAVRLMIVLGWVWGLCWWVVWVAGRLTLF